MVAVVHTEIYITPCLHPLLLHLVELLYSYQISKPRLYLNHFTRKRRGVCFTLVYNRDNHVLDVMKIIDCFIYTPTFKTQSLHYP